MGYSTVDIRNQFSDEILATVHNRGRIFWPGREWWGLSSLLLSWCTSFLAHVAGGSLDVLKQRATACLNTQSYYSALLYQLQKRIFKGRLEQDGHILWLVSESDSPMISRMVTGCDITAGGLRPAMFTATTLKLTFSPTGRPRTT